MLLSFQVQSIAVRKCLCTIVTINCFLLFICQDKIKSPQIYHAMSQLRLKKVMGVEKTKLFFY